MGKIKKTGKPNKNYERNKLTKLKNSKNQLQAVKKNNKKNILDSKSKNIVKKIKPNTDVEDKQLNLDSELNVEDINVDTEATGKTQSKKVQKEQSDKTKSLEKKIVGTAEGGKTYDPEDAEKTLFIGNLPPNTKKLQLIKLCSQFGEVKTVRLRTTDGVVLFKHKVRKKAHAINGYVVMKDAKYVEKALKMSGMEYKGHHLRITRASKSTDEFNTKRVIFVGNLKYSATDENLFNIFSNCGEIEYVRTLQSNKGCKGVAFVCFKKPESVGLALELNNTMLDERPIHVERYSKNKLGAREKRQGEKENELTGALKRIKEKPGKKKKTLKNAEKMSTKPESKKKSEYRGVQIGFKKKAKKKKKADKMVQLAKKIAPKSL